MPHSSLHVSLETIEGKPTDEMDGSVAKPYHVVRSRNSGVPPSYEIKEVVNPATDIEIGQLTVSGGVLRIDGLLDSFALVSGASRKLSGIFDGEDGKPLIKGRALGSLQGPPNLSFTLTDSSKNTEVQVNSSMRSDYGDEHVQPSSQAACTDRHSERHGELVLNLTETSLPLEENLRHQYTSQSERIATPKQSRDLVQDTPAAGRFKDLITSNPAEDDNDLEGTEDLELPRFSQSTAANQQYEESMPSIVQFMGENTEPGASCYSNGILTPGVNSQSNQASPLSSRAPPNVERSQRTRVTYPSVSESKAVQAYRPGQSPEKSPLSAAKPSASTEGQENFSTPLEDAADVEQQPILLQEKTDADQEEEVVAHSSQPITNAEPREPEPHTLGGVIPGALETDVSDRKLAEPEPQERCGKRKSSEPPSASLSTAHEKDEALRNAKRIRTSHDDDDLSLQDTTVKLKTYGKLKTPAKAPKSSQILRDPPAMVFSNSTVPESPKSMKFLKRSGAAVVKTIEGNNFDILVVGRGELKKTPKLLMAVALGKPIVTDEWVKACIDEDGFLAPLAFVARDIRREEEWGYDPGNRSDRTRLLDGRAVHITPALKKAWGGGYKDIKALAEVMGAASVVSRPVTSKDSDSDGTIFLGVETDDEESAVLMQRGNTVFSRDLLPFAVLRGGLNLEDKEFALPGGDRDSVVLMESSKKEVPVKRRGRPRRHA